MTTIPTGEENIFSYDYGQEINDKLVSLGWTAKQYDGFLDFLHEERSVGTLVSAYLRLAPIEELVEDAGNLGIFEEAEEDDE